MNRSALGKTDQRPGEVQSSSRSGSRRFVWLLLAVLALTALARWHRLEVPMERDEGEYAYAGQLLLQGTPPYVEAYNMKLPGIYVCYASIMAVFGQTIWGVHFGLLIVNLASIVLVFLIGRRLIDDLAGLGAAAVFATLSMDPSMSGMFANSEHFVILPMLLGTLTLLEATRRSSARWLFAAGCLMGVAFTIKQHGIAFIAMGALMIAAVEFGSRPIPWRRWLMRTICYGCGALLPFALICLWMLLAGVFKNFWFWTFTYAAEYVSQATWLEARNSFTEQVSTMGGALTGLWLLAVAGLTAMLWDSAARKQWKVLITITLCSIAAVCPGFMFRDHYFLFVLPAAALLAGIVLSAAAKRITRSAGQQAGMAGFGVILIATIGWDVGGKWDLLASLSNAEMSRAICGLNPFPESPQIGEYLRRNSAPTDRIAVIGSEPQLYFYSGLRAATSYIYTYAMMEEQPFALQMQKKMIQQIEHNQPKWIALVIVDTSWLRRPNSPQEIFTWSEKYVADNYEQTGAVDLQDSGSIFRWDAEMKGWQPPQKGFWVGIFRRKPG